MILRLCPNRKQWVTLRPHVFHPLLDTARAVRVLDWVEDFYGESWRRLSNTSLEAAVYTARQKSLGLPFDDDVVVASVGMFLHFFHISELNNEPGISAVEEQNPRQP